MKKVKRSDSEPIKDLGGANTALGEAASIRRQLRELESELNEDIDRLKAVVEAKSAPLLARLGVITRGLHAYTEFNHDLFKERQSIELTFGTIGLHKGTHLEPLPKGSWKQVLGNVKRLAFVEAIRTKEEVNKEALERWTDERLLLVGARRVQTEEPFYEINAQYLEGTKNGRTRVP